ncbi:hypothetical protein [Sporosarcina sp. UB5]|uniref:hypothetical protein n=1 Tax=Sporosarcina sp. UB5 TaxID=3047463 RepID=UPI003D7BED07
MSEDKKSTMDGFALAMSAISIGLYVFYVEPLNDIGPVNLSFYFGLVLVAFGVGALLMEISNIIQKDSGSFSDIGMAVILSIPIFIGWRLIKYYDWVNNFTVSILLFISLFALYGLYRGIFTMITFSVDKKHNKKDITMILLRAIPIVVSIVALFFK